MVAASAEIDILHINSFKMAETSQGVSKLINKANVVFPYYYN